MRCAMRLDCCLNNRTFASWTAMSFPIVLVDEGQDLRPQRLRMLVALSGATHVLIAADEFQCLDQVLRPNPLVAWLQNAAVPETLVQVRRTNVGGLLAAATVIRSSQAPVNGQGFRILQPGVSVPLAATLLANAIAWRQGGDVAVITPALQGGYAQSVIARYGKDPVVSSKMGRTPSTGKELTAMRHSASSEPSSFPRRPRPQRRSQLCAPFLRPGQHERRSIGSTIRFTQLGAWPLSARKSKRSSRETSRCAGSMVAAGRISSTQ